MTIKQLEKRVDKLELRLMNSYIALREYGGHKDGCEYIREISNYCTCHYLTQMLADWKVLGHPTDSTQEEFLAGIERSRSV